MKVLRFIKVIGLLRAIKLTNIIIKLKIPYLEIIYNLIYTIIKDMSQNFMFITLVSSIWKAIRMLQPNQKDKIGIQKMLLIAQRSQLQVQQICCRNLFQVYNAQQLLIIKMIINDEFQKGRDTHIYLEILQSELKKPPLTIILTSLMQLQKKKNK
ncbi:unnamed protein product [Paramecium sonneborni]|uniref:Uncharacterized protein n=1 Tax=Paramecium sonneborni TaxID=65129 RepID=A0A8S1LT64_9CILI|nr:unnamed protein product [Paramecium sonneborni]